MRVLHVIPSISPEHGGPSESVWRLATGLHHLKLAEVALWTTNLDTSAKFMEDCQTELPDTVFFDAWRTPLGAFSFSFSSELRKMAGRHTLVHIHSVFNPITLAAASICRSKAVRYVISPRGMLQPWSLRQKALQKKIFRRIFLDRHLRGASGVHVTSEFERESFAAEYPGIAVVSIPNPIPKAFHSDQGFLERYPEFRGKRILLYLARIHPKKGVSELLEAWRRVTDEHPDWHLVLVGPGQPGNVRRMQTSIMRLKLHQRVSWLGPLFDGERDEAYRAAELFIQPSYQENFGNSIAEAMAVGCPVITTQETPWKILNDNHWGWWVPMSVESLAQSLREALALPREELKRRGDAARAWIETQCSVEAVCGKMAGWYSTLLT